MKKDHRKALLISAFTAGMLLGWIVLGWWLFPVKQTTALYNNQSTRTRLVRLLAKDYWEKGDLSRIRPSLQGWDERELARLLKEMQQETYDPEQLKRLSRLEADLLLPVPELTLADLYSKREIGWSLNISLGLVIAAAVARLWPENWRSLRSLLTHFRHGEPDANEDEKRTALPARQEQEQPQPPQGAGHATPQPEPPAEADEESLASFVQSAQAEDEDRREQTTDDTQEQIGEGQYAVKEVKAEGSATRVSVAEVKGQETSQKEREEGRKATPDPAATANAEEGARQQRGPATAETETEDSEESDDLQELGEPENLNDVLSSIFEEEDETLHELAALSEGLDEIDIMHLVNDAQEISRELREINGLHRRPISERSH
ncbi:MAG: hypothetical protein U9R48_06970 [Chloroflexota bacterium]|nr:hypothetical protein [Chloroflexota bacterium]